MNVRAQLMMVMALDKCVGCHACSITCKRSWTDRPGSEHAWFNNVETRPGVGYPAGWETVDRAGGERSLSGKKAAVSEEYYEPWTYDFAHLTGASLVERPPAAEARSLVSGEPLRPRKGPNWDDDVIGTLAPQTTFRSAGEAAREQYEQMFMLYLPRICNHCLDPPCAKACPTHAISKRSVDGIVVVDDARCKGKGRCVPACPYGKVYLNRLTGKAEKCMFCLPGVTENGLPTLCSETCVGRLRFIGVVLYDADAVAAAADSRGEAGLVEFHRGLFLDAADRAVRVEAERAGIAHSWLEAAERSPVYALVRELRVALPLHPEFRTLPMVWYVPPLSPLLGGLSATATLGAQAGEDPTGHPGGGPGGARGVEHVSDAPAVGPLFGSPADLRIPVEYLAGLFAAGDTAPVEEALKTLMAMREYKRQQQMGADELESARRLGAEPQRLERLFRLLAIGERKDRFVIPTADPSFD